jgi:hypothetical protein
MEVGHAGDRLSIEHVTVEEAHRTQALFAHLIDHRQVVQYIWPKASGTMHRLRSWRRGGEDFDEA